MVDRCRECGLPTEAEELNAYGGVCMYCVKEKPDAPRSTISSPAIKPIEVNAPSIILTTGLDIPGREIAEIVKIVAAEAALGMNVFRDIANNWRDALGGRSGSVQTILKDARESCLLDLKREAQRAGADAVIAVRLNYSEASTSAGTGGGILFVAASGTAVKLKEA